MVVFFALSGVWQRFGWVYANNGIPKKLQSIVALLSTVHTGRGLKNGANLSSPLITTFVVAMAASLVLTVVLGVMLAFRFGHKRIAIVCLIIGTIVPLLLCLGRAFT